MISIHKRIVLLLERSDLLLNNMRGASSIFYQGDTVYIKLTDDMVGLVEAESGTIKPVVMSWMD